jgi:crotonobetainyl-CoA:carnitine CoA-transferase CaiB-like acyl-CoA transferase
MPYGPINNMHSVFEDSQVKYNNIVQTITDLQTYESPIKVPGSIEIEKNGSSPNNSIVYSILQGPAINYSSFENSATFRHSPPLLGQHTDIVLKDLLNYTDTQIEQLRNKKII